MCGGQEVCQHHVRRRLPHLRQGVHSKLRRTTSYITAHCTVPLYGFCGRIAVGRFKLVGAAVQVDVNGPNASPVFQFLKQHTPADMGGSADIDWNFAKWVVRLSTLCMAELVLSAICNPQASHKSYEKLLPR